MLIRSISAGSASATAHVTACATIRSYKRSRSGACTAFESHTPGMCLPGCRMTAAATTGPARQPRPTSSTPATCTNPTRRSAFSSVRMAGTRVIAGQVGRVSRVGLVGRKHGGSDLPGPPDLSDPPDRSSRFGGVFHPRGLALQVAQVVQLRPADFGRSRDFHLLDRRRVERKDALDALSERHLAHRERRARAAAVQADYDAFENLNALLVALAHFHVHANGVARLYRRPFGQLRLLHQLNRAHHSLL